MQGQGHERQYSLYIENSLFSRSSALSRTTQTWDTNLPMIFSASG
eukprot:SAG31_NODE_43416_length_267_cov_0.619048_1_plen_44_part_01